MCIRDRYNIIIECRKNTKYFLTEMNHEDFLSTEPLEKSITNRKKIADGETVDWLQMRWIRLEEKNHFVQVQNKSLS